ncbi:MAG: hypothetical protein RLZZ15_2144 [Verrucomicrobiota bacterium]
MKTEPISAAARDRRRLFLWLGAMLAIVAAWSVYTQHAWEDFYISYRVSRNLALGHGFVFQLGERLHTYTSPLHTLLLAGLAKIGGTQLDPSAVLWLYRLSGGLALGGTVFLVHQLGRSRGWAAPALLAGLGLIALDPKSIDFTVSGMEAPLLLFFLALHLHALLGGSGWKQLGLAWAGMMWTRPDAFVFILAGVMAQCAFGCADRAERIALFRRSVRAAAFGAALYVPWLIGASLYYGTPVPHTIVAKGVSHQPLEATLRAILRSPWDMLTQGTVLTRIYGASYTRLVSDWGAPFHYGWRALALVAWLYWLNPRGSRAARMFSLSFLLATLYGANAPFRPWYAPPYALLASVTWGFIVADLVRALAPHGRWRYAAVALAVGLVGFQTAASVAMARTMRYHQAIDETGNRQVIGEWLKAHGRPGDTVFLECVGYIGYYSDLKMYDFPGMTSREMVAARRKLGTDDYAALIAELNPDWLVLRPGEREAVNRSRPEMLARGTVPKTETSAYELVTIFDRSADVAALRGVLGRRYLQTDQKFEIYRRRASSP